MSHKPRWLAVGIMTAALLGGAFALRSTRSHAADHLDPPGRTNPAAGGMDRNADIADVFAWHRGTGATQSVVMALAYAGPNAPTATQAIPCDRGVLYTIHVDNTGDGASDRRFDVRFGRDSAMNCFARWEGLPGTTGPVVTRVERTNDLGGGVRTYVGLRDDAFFFDLQGFNTTLMTGTLSFVNDRDFFAGQNTAAIVIEVPATAINNGQNTIRVWATTARSAM
ncbi:MAG: DUF4331 family protein [Deltaproteobacteria bacterium]|nr:DUF4331 family protein [Deltaproteobacteria bacterium]